MNNDPVGCAQWKPAMASWVKESTPLKNKAFAINSLSDISLR